MGGHEDFSNYKKWNMRHAVDMKHVMKHISLRPLYFSYAFGTVGVVYFILRTAFVNPDSRFLSANGRAIPSYSSNNRFGFRKHQYYATRDYATEGKPPNHVDLD